MASPTRGPQRRGGGEGEPPTIWIYSSPWPPPVVVGLWLSSPSSLLWSWVPVSPLKQKKPQKKHKNRKNQKTPKKPKKQKNEILRAFGFEFCNAREAELRREAEAAVRQEVLDRVRSEPSRKPKSALTALGGFDRYMYLYIFIYL